MALPPRPQEGEQYWKRIDDLFYRTLAHAERALKINTYINLAVVVIGGVLFIYSIIYGWVRGLDAYAVAFGGLGVASFLGSFFIGPQLRIQKTVGDLTQIQVFYRTYCAQWENIMDWARNNQQHMTLEELGSLNKQLEERTTNTVEKIEKFVGT